MAGLLAAVWEEALWVETPTTSTTTEADYAYYNLFGRRKREEGRSLSHSYSGPFEVADLAAETTHTYRDENELKSVSF
jgi:hypothetical protein